MRKNNLLNAGLVVLAIGLLACTNSVMATGEDCTDPILMTLPYSVTGATTCGFGADYNDSCQSYDNEEDVIFAIDATAGMCIDFTLTGAGGDYPLLLISPECTDFTNCLYNQYAYTSLVDSYTFATAGTYYLMVDSDSGAGCITYDFDVALCPTFGACCHPDGSCTDEPTEGDCTGVFQGTGTDCATTSCPQPCTYKATATLSPGMSDYVDTNTNCGDGNDYANTCLGSYDSGEDAIYELDVTADMCVNITLTSDTTYTGIAVDDICPLDAGTSDCIDKSTSSGTDESIDLLALTAGTYYLMLDTYASPDCINDYTLTISECSAGGACCHTDGSCTDEADEATCTGLGGTWQGEGTECATTSCPQPPQPGDNCADPLVINIPGDLPYATTDTTVDRGDDYADTCMGSYDGGDDIIYQLNVAADTCVNIALDASNSWAGIAIDDACPLDGTCIATATSSSNPDEINMLTLTAGTYYMMADIYPSPYTFDFDLTITECPAGGACCHPDGSCTDEIDEAACTGAGGIYEGDGTECASTACPQPCVADYSVTAPGTWSADNTGGSSNCDLRAADRIDVIYEVVIPSDGDWIFSLCGSSYDTVMAIGSTCCDQTTGYNDDNYSVCGSGGNSHIETTGLTAGTYYVTIESYSAAPTGEGTHQLSISLPPTGGACCHPDGSCTDEADEATCTGAGGIYEGDATECATTSCPPPPPANDECTGKEVVYDGTTTFTFYGATDSEPAAACDDGDTFTSIYKDVWFNYTATCSGALTAQTCDAGTTQDTKLMVYDGCTCPVSGDVAMYCADDGCSIGGYESYAEFSVTSGNCYKIRVGLYGATSSADELGATLNIQCVEDTTGACCETGGGCADGVEEAACAGTFMGIGTTCATVTCPPANDTCEYATSLSCGTPATQLIGETTVGATNDYDGSACSGYATASPDVVYEFTLATPKIVTVIMDATVDAGYSGWDNALYLVTDCADIAGTCVVGSDYTTNGLEGGTTTSALPAGTYYLICDGWGGEQGDFDLILGCEDPPSTGGCCIGGVCTDDVLEGDCAGTWFGGELCADITCPPANDDCLGKPEIFEGTTPFDTTSATTDGPAHPGSDCDVYGNDQVWDDIWYNFTATCTGMLTVDTCLGDTADDTRVAVYDTCVCPVTDEDLLICNDDAAGACPAGSYMSMASTMVTNGDCYKIRVGNYSPGGASAGLVNVALDCFFCGDGDVNLPGEECDDGNNDDGDGCSATCVIEFCGDAITNNIDEECDDGNAIDTDACIDCELATCGDGYVWFGEEECDDAGESATCDADCTDAFCGDGTVNATRGEECDAGGMSATCDPDCTVPVCGDGVLNPFAGEMCDDGNTEPLDGCSAACKLEAPVPTPATSHWGMLLILLALGVGVTVKTRRTA